MDIEKLLQVPDKLSATDTLFAAQADYWNNACVNWCADGWGLYASGYLEASDLLVEGILNRKGTQDQLVYPILFGYRQYLELTLKDMLRKISRINTGKYDFPPHHRVMDLWNDVRIALPGLFPQEKEKFEEVTRLIRELSSVDPMSMAFRYPKDMKGNDSLPAMRHINLRNIREVMEKLAFQLSGLDEYIAQRLSFGLEMEATHRNDSGP